MKSITNKTIAWLFVVLLILPAFALAANYTVVSELHDLSYHRLVVKVSDPSPYILNNLSITGTKPSLISAYKLDSKDVTKTVVGTEYTDCAKVTIEKVNDINGTSKDVKLCDGKTGTITADGKLITTVEQQVTVKEDYQKEIAAKGAVMPAGDSFITYEWFTPIQQKSSGWGSSGQWSINPSGWYNTSWTYRRNLTITNNYADDWSNYPINITIDTSDAAKFGNCSGIRIMWNDTYEIPWSNSTACGSATTVLWFLANVTNSASSTYYQLYYGNLAAPDRRSSLDSVKGLRFDSTAYFLWHLKDFSAGTGNRTLSEGSNTMAMMTDSGGSQRDYSLKNTNRSQCLNDGCVVFNGTNENLMGTAQAIGTGSSFTIEAWVYSMSNNVFDGNVIVARGATSGSDFSWRHLDNDGNRDKALETTNGADCLGNVTLPRNVWMLYTMRFNHVAGTISFSYSNGNYVTAGTCAKTFIDDGGNTAPWRIGSQAGTTRFFKGYVDEVAVYTSYRSDVQLKHDGLVYFGNVTLADEEMTAQQALPTCKLVSRTPTNMNDSSTGTLNIVLNCTSSVGINVTKTGDHYWAFVTSTLDSYQIADGVPNRWSIRPPDNNLAQNMTGLGAYGRIGRAQGRGRGFWYEDLNKTDPNMNLSTWFLYDNYSYSAEDGHYGYLVLTNTSSTTALLNYTSPSIPLSIFRQNIPLSYDSLVQEGKKNLTINKNQQILTYRNDLEAMKGTKNYTITVYRDIGTTPTAPSAVLRAFYCNSSYSPTGGVTVLTSPNCVLINSLTPAQLAATVLTDKNSTYSSGIYSIINGKIGGIAATPYHYYYYDTLESNPTYGYRYRYVNSSTITNVSFANTGRLWTSSTDGATWTSFPATLDLIEFTVKDNDDEFMFGYCIYDLNGDMGCNESVVIDEITATNHPISNPVILIYNSSRTENDDHLDGVHSGMMQILVGCAKDPDNVSAVTHNLSLRFTNGVFNASINSSFLCNDDANTWISFNTSLVPDGIYKMNISAKANDNPNDIETFQTAQNFTIDNYPQYGAYFTYPIAGTNITGSSVTVTWKAENGTGSIYSHILYLQYSDGTISKIASFSQSDAVNASFSTLWQLSGVPQGFYTLIVNVTNNENVATADSGEFFYQPSPEADMIIAIMILIPLFFAGMLLYGVSIVGDEHRILRMFFFLLSYVSVFISLWWGSMAVEKYTNFTLFSDSVAQTTYYLGLLFFAILSYFCIYLMWWAFDTFAQKKREKLNYD